VLIPAGNNEVSVLGTLADGKTPSLVKKGWCVYSLAPCMPAELLRQFAAEAGIHLFSGSKDNYFIGNGLLGVYAAYDGEKVIDFPAYCGEITELFSGRKWQKGTRRITVKMQVGDALLFDCGLAGSR
jgi:hypothetical protein